jgi:predicted Zn-dependent protease
VEGRGALREAMIGEADRARKKTEQGLQLTQGTEVHPFFPLALTLAGNAEQAQTIADKMNQEHPLDTIIQNYWLPSVQGAIELQKNNAGRAIEILQKAIPYETGNGAGCLSPIYVRGLAYLQAGQGQQAALEFRKVVDHPELLTNCLAGALSRLQLARAQAMMGDKAPARKSYQDFLALWKDADPDIPIYRQAKEEYAKLP